MLNSLYFHIPFCTTRCGYCDFNTYAGMNHLIPKYLIALCKEVEIYSGFSEFPPEVHTIYFGGGTPSLLPLDALKRLIQSVRLNFQILGTTEITLEANPGNVDDLYFTGLHELGFNRISLGMQSANPDELAILNRHHDFEQVVRSVNLAKKAGIPHISLDLIFGIPGQSMESWKKTLQAAIALPIDHLSLYSLTIEEGTLLQKQILSKIIAAPDEDLAGSMYEYALDLLPGESFAQYEISNWAINPAAQSQHNKQYWKCLPYYGFGAGAHGYLGHYRYENIPGINAYISSLEDLHPLELQQVPSQVRGSLLSTWEEMQEFMMLGLRLTQEGVSRNDFQERFSYSLEEIFGEKIKKLIITGLIEEDPLNKERLKLTRKGTLFGNRVFIEFVGNKKPAILKD